MGDTDALHSWGEVTCEENEQQQQQQKCFILAMAAVIDSSGQLVFISGSLGTRE
jgi:hypothetical protein